MTFRQLHDTFTRKIDKSLGAAFQPRDKDRILNEAVVECVEQWAKGFELNAEYRDALAGLTRKPFVGNGRSVRLAEIPDFSRLTALDACWQQDELGSDLWLPVEPIATETRSRRRRSWIHRATDDKPGYVEYSTSGNTSRILEIESESDPVRWRVSYVAQPQLIEGFTKPDQQWTDFTAWAQNQILKTARRIAAAEIVDGPSYQLGQQEQVTSSI